MVIHRGGHARPPVVTSEDDDRFIPTRPPPPMITDITGLSLCNFMLGFTLAFSETYFSYLLVENFSPTVVQLVYCVMYSPWIAKPLYARTMDRNASAYETYIQKLLPMSACIWFVVLIAEDRRVTLCLFVLDALVISFTDVAMDAIMVKRAKLEPDEREVQSNLLIWRALGMMVGAYLGGLVMNSFGAVAVFACCIVEAVVFCAFSYLLSDIRTAPSSSEPVVRFRDTMTPQMRKALLFTFLVHAVPDLSGLYDFVLIDELKFTPLIIGSLDMIGYIAVAMGACLYNMAFKGNSNKRMVQFALVLVGIECILPIAVILRWNRRVGMSDITLASMDGFFRSASGRMLVMPITGAIMPYCTAGHEATIYALFTSISNVSTIMSMALGSAMSAAVGMKRGNMTALWGFYLARGLLFLALAPAAGLLPDKRKDAILAEQPHGHELNLIEEHEEDSAQ